jgi:hypothetical protein
MHFKNLLSLSFFLVFVFMFMLNLSTVKAGGCKGIFSITHSDKDTTWVEPLNVNDSLTINPGDTIHLNWSISCEGDEPDYVICYWYKDGVLLKKDSVGGTFPYADKDSLLITEGGVYTIELPVFGQTFTLNASGNLTGINNPALQSPVIEIYPNPVSNILNMKFKIPTPTRLNYFIFNDIGQAVKSGEISVDGIENNELNIEELTAGLYTMLISYNNKQQTSKFVKN